MDIVFGAAHLWFWFFNMNHAEDDPNCWGLYAVLALSNLEKGRLTCSNILVNISMTGCCHQYEGENKYKNMVHSTQLALKPASALGPFCLRYGLGVHPRIPVLEI